MSVPTTQLGRVACPSTQDLADFYAGRLPDEHLVFVAEHLSACETCMVEMGTIQAKGLHSGLDSRLRQALITKAPAEMPPSTAPTSLVGSTFGAFTLGRELGAGGMGIVYLARSGTESPVALKMLRNRVAPSAETVRRFKTESEAIARLEHPNIVRLFHFDEHAGMPYYTMEYIPGENLAKRLRRGPMRPQKAAELVRILAEAIAYAHHHNVVHRDLKPGNILLSAQGIPKIADFGLAKLSDSDTSLPTHSDAILGTPTYMAPEHALGWSARADGRTDVYSLGAILYECLTGKPPFTGTNDADVLEQVRHHKPVPPTQRFPELSPHLEAICLKCLEKNPNRRYPSAQALADDLTLWLREGRAQATPSRAKRYLKKAQRLSIPVAILFGMVALTVALQWTDPDRPVRLITRDLERGRPVKLLTKDHPTPYRIRTGSDYSKVTQNKDGSITVFAWGGTTLVEVLPHLPTDRFTLRAQVKHENAEVIGQVGLYAAHQSFVSAKPEGMNFYAGLVFNDLRRAEDLRADFPPEHAAKLVFPTTNVASVGTGMVGSLGDLLSFSVLPRAKGVLFEPAGKPSVWRTLQMDVTPEGIVSTWNGQQFEHFSRETFLSIFDEQVKFQQQRVPDDPYLPNIRPTFKPNGAIGMMVYQGSATFKDIEVIPVAD